MVESVTADDREDEGFSEGDFSDPAEIHSEDMPGLMEISRGDWDGVPLLGAPDGARMEYATGDPLLVSALHEWFAAQISNHGDYASSEGEHSSHY